MRKVIVTLSVVLVAGAAVARERSIRYEPPAPLHASVLMNVNLDFGSIDLAPGATHKLQLYIWQCCVYPMPVFADVRYYMDPSEVAQLDGATGNLTISPLARGGATLRVYADIEHGKRIISADVHVETPASNPLRGYWRQVAEIPCDGSGELPVLFPLAELVFKGDRTFYATWFPFEVYKDYWGFYTFDHPAGRISMGINQGNYVPTGFRGDGTYAITTEAGKRVLRLKGMSLGRYRSDPLPANCGGVFVED